jgi:putative Holliday junction resolvase
MLFPVRLLGIDYGRRRIGLALSDASGVLARPWRTLDAARTPQASAAALAALLATLREADDPEAGDVRAAIVGLPRRLSGEEHEQTQAARRFADELGRLSGLQVYLQDERLSSVEAEQRLAVRERDWRARKKKIDAAAAAVILQDFLDTRPRPPAGGAPDA